MAIVIDNSSNFHTRTDLKMLSERCQMMDELDVSDSTSLTSDCIPYFFNFKEISYISISRCYHIEIAAYE